MVQPGSTSNVGGSPGRLRGRKALVTGGASGMGRAIAHRLVDEGAHVAILDYNGDEAKKAVVALNSPGRVLAIQGDTSSINDIDRSVSSVVDAFGGIDILVNNAGVFDYNQPCEELEEHVWDRLMAVNVRGYAFVMKRVLAEMLPAGRGAIINNCSVSALVAGGGGAAYSASKGAILALNRQVAFEVGSRGIRVNAIAPGAVDTNINANVAPILGHTPSGSMQRHFNEMMTSTTASKIPLGRVAPPTDIAPVVAFLASDDAAYITGECLVVDGGYVIH